RLRLRDRALRLDVVVVRGRVADLEALAPEPGLDRTDLRLRGRETPAELGGRDVVAVGRRLRVAYGLCECLSVGAPAEVDAEDDGAGGIGSAHEIALLSPGRGTPVQR